VDSADGSGLNPAANTVMMKYAVIGDTNLDGTVGLSDYTAMVRNFGTGTNWDQGAIAYGTTVGLADFTALVRNFGQSVPASVAAAQSASSATTALPAGDSSTPTLQPIQRLARPSPIRVIRHAKHR